MKIRKGFTLVELLIVIVIIGILAAAMMLSSGSTTASAKASTIISDLRGIKTAAILFWGTSMDSDTDATIYEAAADNDGKPKDALKSYMDNPDKMGDYFLYRDEGTGKWWVGIHVADTAVAEKLAGRAKAVGLLKEPKVMGEEYEGGTGNTDYVYMIVK